MVSLPLANQLAPTSEPNLTRRVCMEIYEHGLSGSELRHTPEIYGTDGAIGFRKEHAKNA